MSGRPKNLSEHFYVFAYGSLMWDPGFAFDKKSVGVLFGYRRSACILSIKYRGTPEQPGIVLGLDEGGSCRGFVYAVPRKKRRTVLSYLRKREMLNGVFEEKTLKVKTVDGEEVSAICFVANKAHERYVGKILDSEKIPYIVKGRGESGTSLDYLANTLIQLERRGIKDVELSQLFREAMEWLELPPRMRDSLPTAEPAPRLSPIVAPAL